MDKSTKSLHGNFLWHAIKLENIEKILSNGHLECRTTQRYWPKSKLLKDDDPNYELESQWMKGWSFTRDKNYAFSWAGATGVVISVNYDLIKQDFEILPMYWGATIGKGHTGNHKREREEFIVGMKSGKTSYELKLSELKTKYTEDEVEEITNNGIIDESIIRPMIDWWLSPYTESNINISKYVDGIYLTKNVSSYASAQNISDIQKYRIDEIRSLVKHDKFKGTIFGANGEIKSFSRLFQNNLDLVVDIKH